MLQVLLNSSPILVAILFGYLSSQRQWIDPKAKEAIAFIAFKIIVPFLVVKSFAGVKFDSNNANIISGVMILLTISYLISFLVGKVLRMRRKQTGVLVSMLPTFAIGPFTYPFVLANFDQDVFRGVVLIDIIQFLSILVISYSLASVFGTSKKTSWLEVMARLYKNPVIISIAVIMILNYMNVTLPESLLNFADFYSRSFGFLAAFFIGLSLKMPKLGEAKLATSIIMGRVVVVIVVLGGLFSLGLISPIFHKAFYLSFLAPIATLPSIYIRKFGLDETLGSQLVLMSYALSILIFPMALMLG